MSSLKKLYTFSIVEEVNYDSLLQNSLGFKIDTFRRTLSDFDMLTVLENRKRPWREFAIKEVIVD